MERRATLTADLEPELPDEERERRQLEEDEDVVGVSGARVAHVESAADLPDRSPPPPERIERRSSRFAVTPVSGDVAGGAAGTGGGQAEMRVVVEVDEGVGVGEGRAPLARPEVVESPRLTHQGEKSVPGSAPAVQEQEPSKESGEGQPQEAAEMEQDPLLSANERPQFSVDTDESEDVSRVISTSGRLGIERSHDSPGEEMFASGM